MGAAFWLLALEAQDVLEESSFWCLLMVKGEV